MFAAKIIKMLAAHRNRHWFELKMRDPHSGFGLDAVEDPSGSPADKPLPEFSEENAPPAGF